MHRVPYRRPWETQPIVHRAHKPTSGSAQVHRLSAVAQFSTPRPERVWPAEPACHGGGILCHKKKPSALDTRAVRKEKVDSARELPARKRNSLGGGIMNLHELGRDRLVRLVVMNFVNNW